MERIDAIKKIVEDVKEEVIISSTGMVSRDLYAAKDRLRNFYVLGSMGAALGIGIGIAYNRPDLKVIVISGDASCLMSLGTLVLYKKMNLPNLKHYVLDNNCHSSTGGQPTCSDAIDFAQFNTIVYKVSKEKGQSPRIPLKPYKITKRFYESIRKSE